MDDKFYHYRNLMAAAKEIEKGLESLSAAVHLLAWGENTDGALKIIENKRGLELTWVAIRKEARELKESFSEAELRNVEESMREL